MDPSGADDYAAVGHDFFRAAELALSHGYRNAAGLLFVHAAVAYADAVSIRRSGWRSTSENHMDAITLLGSVTLHVERREDALSHLERLIAVKNRAAYTGQSFRLDEISTLAKHAQRFQAWAQDVLAGRK